ncbi:hypothetical protein E8E13_006379 [Curvularia kusanoi]|uniref:Uncharacterized protein n=1 Tax=Curvularia kusanoi TaxID=90978 RepID=A0A9P4T7N0_CURKU|nr:hypothetical protein E8E13_006379 [Curvularia kusanoi]
MVSLCDVGATVMDASVSPTKKSFATVRQDGIWGAHEFPTLQKGAPGNTPADPPSNLLGKKYWVRQGVEVKEGREADIVEARKTCARLTDAEIKELDEIPW